MRTSKYFVMLEITHKGVAGPNEDQIARALAHSTAAEAMSEALDCEVRFWLPSPYQLDAEYQR